ncbi:MAG TPA: flagellar filament capping protein FliD [Clostridiales bacterium]|nr:flagellar filament capping protein FliD [Clostridiales bacterium]
MPYYLNSINTTRFSGLASGIDTETIIQDLMKAENMKVDKLKQEKQIVEWRRDAYREVTNKLRTFKDEFFDITKPSNYMLSSNTYKNYRATISGAEDVLSIDTNADAVPGIYNVKVNSIAQSAKISSAKHFEGLSLNTKVSQLKDAEGNTFDFGTQGSTEIIINGEAITVTRDMTISQLMNEINSNKSANARLTYSSITGKFVLQSKNTGENATLDISVIQRDDNGDIVVDDNGNPVRIENDDFLSFLGITSNKIETGQNAVIEVNVNHERDENGVLIYHKIESSTNTFVKDGIIFNLYDTTIDSDIATIRITEDIDATVDKIKNFVDKYNELIDELNNKLTEKSYRDFPPLTDDQKSEMSEKDIELWEEKAKSGLLRNDSIIQGIVYSMRNALIDNVAGVDIRLSDIGITTGKWYEHGKLYLDEDKLRQAISEAPDKVAELFMKSDGEPYNPDLTIQERSERYSNSGIAQRISDILNDYIRTTRNQGNKKGLLLEKAGIVGDVTEYQNTLNNQIKDYEERIEKMNELLYKREESYWKKFTAMEKAIQQMNVQSMWLSQQLNMGN